MELSQTSAVNIQGYNVRKDNVLIQKLRRRKNELTTLEQKALGFILSNIPDRPNEIDAAMPYRMTFDIKLFCEVCGISCQGGKTYTNAKEALEKLANNTFWIQIGNQTEMMFQWIVTPTINRGKGIAEIEIPAKILHLLVGLDGRYTQYELSQILSLKKKHSIALYEYFKSYSKMRHASISVNDLRSYLGLSDKYKYRDIRKNILIPCIAEINQATNLRVTWYTQNKGKKIEYILFDIKELNFLEVNKQ